MPGGGGIRRDLDGERWLHAGRRVARCARGAGAGTVESCDVEHRGSVDYLYEQVARNPENLDEAEIMAACLVRRDVVAPSFSADDYRRWYDTQGGLLPFTVDERTGERVFDECNADPLGLHG